MALGECLFEKILLVWMCKGGGKLKVSLVFGAEGLMVDAKFGSVCCEE